jgi:hypothetical protein
MPMSLEKSPEKKFIRKVAERDYYRKNVKMSGTLGKTNGVCFVMHPLRSRVTGGERQGVND